MKLYRRNSFYPEDSRQPWVLIVPSYVKTLAEAVEYTLEARHPGMKFEHAVYPPAEWNDE